MQSCYFKIEKLIPPTGTNVLQGYHFAGFVIVEGKLKDGNIAFFPWERYENNEGAAYLVEVTAITKAGCPYPPPCPQAGTIGCY